MLESILFGFYWLYFWISGFFPDDRARKLRDKGKTLCNIKQYYKKASFEDWERESFGRARVGANLLHLTMVTVSGTSSSRRNYQGRRFICR